MGDARNSHGINVEDELVIQRSMQWLGLPFPSPKFYDLAISRTKKGGVELIMAGCILLATLV